MSEHLTRNTEYDEDLHWCHACNMYTWQRRKPGAHRRECQRPEHIQRDARKLQEIRESDHTRKLQKPLFEDTE